MPTSSEYVTLASGLTVPLAAITLAIDLETRGFVLTVQGDDLFVRPGAKLTPTDRALIAKWKLHLLALLAAPEDVQ